MPYTARRRRDRRQPRRPRRRGGSAPCPPRRRAARRRRPGHRRVGRAAGQRRRDRSRWASASCPTPPPPSCATSATWGCGPRWSVRRRHAPGPRRGAGLIRPVVATFLFGSPELYAWADDNPRLVMHRTEPSTTPPRSPRDPRCSRSTPPSRSTCSPRRTPATSRGRSTRGSAASPTSSSGALHSPGGQAVIALRSWHDKTDSSNIVAGRCTLRCARSSTRSSSPRTACPHLRTEPVRPGTPAHRTGRPPARAGRVLGRRRAPRDCAARRESSDARRRRRRSTRAARERRVKRRPHDSRAGVARGEPVRRQRRRCRKGDPALNDRQLPARRERRGQRRGRHVAERDAAVVGERLAGAAQAVDGVLDDPLGGEAPRVTDGRGGSLGVEPGGP